VPHWPDHGKNLSRDELIEELGKGNYLLIGPELNNPEPALIPEPTGNGQGNWAVNPLITDLGQKFNLEVAITRAQTHALMHCSSPSQEVPAAVAPAVAVAPPKLAAAQPVFEDLFARLRKKNRDQKPQLTLETNYELNGAQRIMSPDNLLSTFSALEHRRVSPGNYSLRLKEFYAEHDALKSGK
jgi:hypothetical protein